MMISVYEIYPRDPYKFDIHETAKQMVADGYFGQNMRNQQRCEEYILVAAYDPDIAKKLPPRGFSFWETADFQYRLWKARRQYKRPLRQGSIDE
jgi:hypothetical protein